MNGDSDSSKKNNTKRHLRFVEKSNFKLKEAHLSISIEAIYMYSIAFITIINHVEK